MTITPRAPILITFLISSLATIGSAQKLPNVQTASVRAPANIKIDGKAAEWNNQFQAYNHATDIFYTLSNDDSRLYLTVQAADAQVINKIIGGGITFTVQKSNKKADKDGIAITYPIFDRRSRPYIRNSKGGASGGFRIMSDAVMGGKVDDPKELQGDSIMTVYNKQLADNSKYIAVTGIKSLEDPLISIYNTEGIRTDGRVDNKIVYTYEMSVDLKLLGLSVKDSPAFMYHIAINGSPLFAVPDGSHEAQMKLGNAVSDGHDGSATISVGAMGQEATTDFWGQYTLAKK